MHENSQENSFLTYIGNIEFIVLEHHHCTISQETASNLINCYIMTLTAQPQYLFIDILCNNVLKVNKVRNPGHLGLLLFRNIYIYFRNINRIKILFSLSNGYIINSVQVRNQNITNKCRNSHILMFNHQQATYVK